MGAWVPGRAVPWCLGRLPWVPGAPPGSSQVGVCGPMSESQSVASTHGFRIKIYVDVDIDFWSFWGRSWVPLGGHFRSCWRLFRPKLVPEPSSNRLIFEKVIVHETSAGVVFRAFPGPQESTQNDPRSPQDGSKIVLDRFF